MTADWLEKQLQTPPSDMSTEICESIKKSISESKAQMLGPEKEVGPFYLYLMGDSYESVAEKTGWSLEIIAVTALKFRWYEKKNACSLVSEKEGAKYVLKSAMSAMLAATAHVLTQQSKDVMSGKLDASECRYIPKNVKELQSFMNVVSQIYELNSKNENNQNVTVNIANVGSNQQPAIVAQEDVKVIEAEKVPEDRMSKFRLLRESESKS